MGLIQVKIPDDIEQVLRRHLPAKKGALSEFVTSAIVEKLKKEGVRVK